MEKYIPQLKKAIRHFWSVRESHFKFFPELNDISYQDRYKEFCIRLMRERLYDNSCLILSSRTEADTGNYSESSKEIDLKSFVSSLRSKILSSA